MPQGNERRWWAALICALLSACSIDDRDVAALAPGGGGSGGAMAGSADAGNAGQPSTGGGGGSAGGAAGGAGSSGEGAAGGGDDGMNSPGDDAGFIANGGASGNEDAGTPPAEPLPPLSGELTASFGRVKVASASGRSYIVQNNNWSGIGQQRIRYSGPSLEVITQTAISANGTPVSFPSVYIGRNGDQAGGGMTTSGDDNLPLQVSAIAQIPVTFSHDAVGRDANAAFECWFAPAPPVGQYDAASGAYLMVWLWRPAARNPIGSLSAMSVNIAGRAWNLFVGLRDGVPVVSYLPTDGSIADANFDLAAFIRDAQARDLGVTGSLYLTDVLGGFEIWSGAGIALSNFSVTVLGL